MAELAESKEEIQAKVTGVTKEGLLVELGMKVLFHASQIETRYVKT